MNQTSNLRGSCVIDQRKLLQYPHSMIALNPILAIASMDGCPSNGVLFPKPVDGVHYMQIRHADGSMEMRWDGVDVTTCNHDEQ